MLQRQCFKQDVATALGHGSGGGVEQQGAGFSRSELRELFSLNPRRTPAEGCDTRLLLLAKSLSAAGPDAATALLWPAYAGAGSIAWGSDSAGAAAAAATLLPGVALTEPAEPLVSYARLVHTNHPVGGLGLAGQLQDGFPHAAFARGFGDVHKSAFLLTVPADADVVDSVDVLDLN